MTDLLDMTEPPATLSGIEKAIHACRRCPIGFLENRAVMGEGLKRSTLMVVGEQPGDQEDLAGKPFVGPSGQLLDRYLVEAGIDRRQVYVTNAVKHFKFVWRGKRRLHQSPTAKEIDTCRFWLDGELAILKPDVVLALGVSAARGVLGTHVEPRQPGVLQSMIVVRDPPQPAVARLKELQAQYAGTDLKVGPCAPTS